MTHYDRKLPNTILAFKLLYGANISENKCN